MVILKIAVESKNILANPPDINVFLKYIETHINTIKIFYDQIDPAIAQKIFQQASLILSNMFNVGLSLINNLVYFAIGLPLALMVAFITFIATYFLSKDMPVIENKFLSIFSNTGKEKARNILKEGNSMILGYIKSYAIIISVTFIETLIGFSILGVDYTLILSVVAALVDILPVLGVGSVYMPLAVIYFFAGNKFIPIGLIILYVIVIVVRQVIEPKLVSTSLGIPPVLILAAIFIGLKAYGFLGMIYLIFLIISYRILNKVEIL
jgi:sporulation integral membrane protein YtvI